MCLDSSLLCSWPLVKWWNINGIAPHTKKPRSCLVPSTHYLWKPALLIGDGSSTLCVSLMWKGQAVGLWRICYLFLCRIFLRCGRRCDPSVSLSTLSPLWRDRGGLRRFAVTALNRQCGTMIIDTDPFTAVHFKTELIRINCVFGSFVTVIYIL